MCHNPAILFNIKNRGFVREGYAADLVVIDPKGSTVPEKDNILYKCQWSPLEGSKMKTRVLYTFVNGQLVYDNGSFAENYRGKALEFQR